MIDIDHLHWREERLNPMTGRIAKIKEQTVAHIVTARSVLDAVAETKAGGNIAGFEQAERVTHDIGGVVQPWADPRHEDGIVGIVLAMHENAEHAIVETRIHEYHMEAQGENIMTKDKLLAIGDKYEEMISADKAADAPYR